MPEPHDWKMENLIVSIQKHLELMSARRHEFNETCFTIFTPQLQMIGEPVSSHDSRVAFVDELHKLDAINEFLEDERFLQFAFGEHTLLLDLPSTVITQDESERLLKERSGFFHLLGRPNYWPEDDFSSFAEFDPIQRPFIYGDERLAAEEAAFVLYDLWELPLEIGFKLHSFSSNHDDWDDQFLKW
ncbi:MAG: hypothetical protein R3C03_23345 [Pirellulaceae bacterium]